MSIQDVIQTLQEYLQHAPEAGQDGLLVAVEGTDQLREVLTFDYAMSPGGHPILRMEVSA
jgi:hypothetical protein